MTDAAQNGQQQPQQEEFRIPDFMVALIGRQQIQIAALEAQLQMFQMQNGQQAPEPAVVPAPADPKPV